MSSLSLALYFYRCGHCQAKHKLEKPRARKCPSCGAQALRRTGHVSFMAVDVELNGQAMGAKQIRGLLGLPAS